jgi:hypothetical protein
MTSTVFDPKRRRRLIYNDDADQQYSGSRYNLTDEQSFVDARTAPAFDSHPHIQHDNQGRS